MYVCVFIWLEYTYADMRMHGGIKIFSHVYVRARGERTGNYLHIHTHKHWITDALANMAARYWYGHIAYTHAGRPAREYRTGATAGFEPNASTRCAG